MYTSTPLRLIILLYMNVVIIHLHNGKLYKISSCVLCIHVALVFIYIVFLLLYFYSINNPFSL